MWIRDLHLSLFFVLLLFTLVPGRYGEGGSNSRLWVEPSIPGDAFSGFIFTVEYGYYSPFPVAVPLPRRS